MNKRTSIQAQLILLLAVSTAAAGEIYTWVDAGGVTHFSETAPLDPASGAAQVELDPAPAARPQTADDYYSVINQAARMQARRLASEKLRAERLQAEAEARRARAQELAAQEAARQAASLEEPRYFPLYLYYPRTGHRPYRGHHPQHHDRRHPDYRSGYRATPHRTAANRPHQQR